MSTIVETFKADKKYAGWLWAIKLIGQKLKAFSENTELCPKSWRVYYDEGLNPVKAFWEDIKHA